MSNGNVEKVAWTSLKFVLPVVIVGGGLYVVWSWFNKQSRLDAAKQQWQLYFNAYMDKWEYFNADGTITVEEDQELERERVLLDQAEKDLAAAATAPDPISYAIGVLSIAGGAAIILKWGVPDVLKTLQQWHEDRRKAGDAKTQYTVYEMVHMADALHTSLLDPILATQKMTAAQNLFQNSTMPSMQAQVDFLQQHMQQFTGINLLYAQYMVSNLMLDAAFISQAMFPFAFSLLPLI